MAKKDKIINSLHRLQRLKQFSLTETTQTVTGLRVKNKQLTKWTTVWGKNRGSLSSSVLVLRVSILISASLSTCVTECVSLWCHPPQSNSVCLTLCSESFRNSCLCVHVSCNLTSSHFFPVFHCLECGLLAILQQSGCFWIPWTVSSGGEKMKLVQLHNRLLINSNLH